jgi:hypothetical protein
MSKLIPYQTDEQLIAIINRKYDEYAYQDLPYLIRQAIESRTLTFKRRGPTDYEKLETEYDATEHRHLHNERTIKDFQNKYKYGKEFKLSTPHLGVL